jgi:hypothetical protein
MGVSFCAPNWTFTCRLTVSNTDGAKTDMNKNDSYKKAEALRRALELQINCAPNGSMQPRPI